MTKAGFTFDGTDPGATAAVMLVQKRVGLTPEHRRRFVAAGSRPGVWDFGTEFGERRIELDVVTGDNASLAGTDAAIRTLAQLFDPTNEVAGDKGFKQLILDSENDRYWLAKLVSDPFTEYLPSAGKLTLTMRCADPFAYSTTQYVVQGGSATITGFSAYRQIPDIPDVGAVHGLNLVKNGGFVVAVGAEWSLVANASVVADALSPSGYAMRHVATGLGQNSTQVVPVEPGKVYYWAMSSRGDGTAYVGFHLQWLNAALNVIRTDAITGPTTSGSYTETASAAITAPGNATSARLNLRSEVAAGIVFVTAIRVKQQATAPLAWTAADQQVLGNKGLAIYEAATNLVTTDGDMELAGIAAWGSAGCTLSKTTTNPFMGAQRLTITNTASNGFAARTGALAAGQPITASVRCIGADAGAGIILYSTPSFALIGNDQGASADWSVRRVSGVIAGGDTGWEMRLQGGTGAAVVSHYDNAAVENKAYDTMNADPSGLAFNVGARTASSVTEALPSGFDITDFARVVVVRFDHAYNRGGVDRRLASVYVDANNYIDMYVGASGQIVATKTRAGISLVIGEASPANPAAGDTIVAGIKVSPTSGITLFVSKNGAAVTTRNTAVPEALLPLSGTPVLYVGKWGGDTGDRNLDGTVGIDRLLGPGLTAAQISASLLNPYAQQDESYESAVYREVNGVWGVENYAAPTLHVDVGGTYKTDPVVEITANGAFTGALTVTDANGNVLTWTGTLALNDVLKVDSGVYRVYLNGVVSMAGLSTASAWPSLKPNQRNDLVIGGIAAANIKAIKTTFRSRWI